MQNKINKIEKFNNYKITRIFKILLEFRNFSNRKFIIKFILYKQKNII